MSVTASSSVVTLAIATMSTQSWSRCLKWSTFRLPSRLVLSASTATRPSQAAWLSWRWRARTMAQTAKPAVTAEKTKSCRRKFPASPLWLALSMLPSASVTNATPKAPIKRKPRLRGSPVGCRAAMTSGSTKTWAGVCPPNMNHKNSVDHAKAPASAGRARR